MIEKLNYKIFFRELINSFRLKGFFRSFTPIIRERKTFPFTQVEYGKKDDNIKTKEQLKIWCTNDYLNMSHNQQVIDEMVSVINRVGTGSGGTRNISGTTPFHQNLENSLRHPPFCALSEQKLTDVSATLLCPAGISRLDQRLNAPHIMDSDCFGANESSNARMKRVGVCWLGILE